MPYVSLSQAPASPKATYTPLVSAGPAPSPAPAPAGAGYVSLSSGGAKAAAAPAPTAPTYFQGGGFGASNITDTSGKPLLTYSDPNLKASVLDTTRVATTFDPRVPQKMDAKTFYNPRAVANRATLKQQMGGNYSDELDHKIALELSGSNAKSNLQIEPLIPDTKNTATDPLENSLAKDVAAGKTSLFDAQTQLAKAKKTAAPFTGEAQPAPETPPQKPSSLFGAVNDWVQNFGRAVDRGLYQVGKYTVEPVKHPLQAVEGAGMALENFGLGVAKGLSAVVGAKKATDYLQTQQDALNELVAQHLQGNADKEAAYTTGSWVGSIIPYVLTGSVVEKAAVGAAGPLLAGAGGITLKGVETAGKIISKASQLAGFLGTGQITHEANQGSRADQLKNDLITYGIFEAALALPRAFSQTISKLRAGETVPFTEAENAVAAAKTEFKAETGTSGEEYLAAKLQGPKAFPEAPKANPVEALKGREGAVNPSEFATGLKETAKANAEDVRAVAGGVKEAASEVRGGLSPQTASPEAQAAADEVRQAKAKIANLSAIESSKYSAVAKGFGKFSDAENIGNISEYERTGNFKNAPEGYSEFYKQSTDESRKMLQQAYGEDKVGYVENYVRRAFVFGSKADEEKATEYLGAKVRSLSASKSPLKGACTRHAAR